MYAVIISSNHINKIKYKLRIFISILCLAFLKNGIDSIWIKCVFSPKADFISIIK